jgi:hypothetical protein
VEASHTGTFLREILGISLPSGAKASA